MSKIEPGDLPRAELEELLAGSKLQGGPGYVIEKSTLRALVDEVMRRRDETPKKIRRRKGYRTKTSAKEGFRI